MIRRSIRRCSTCEAVTPHSRRLLNLSWTFAGFVLAGAPWLGTLLTVLLGIVALVAVRLDWSLCWPVECERCRWGLMRERVLLRRKTRPNPPYSTIDLWF